jgi:hypothetical protein
MAAITTDNLTLKAPTYYHAPFSGNPWKNGVVNVSTDVPKLPISMRQTQHGK